MKLLGEGGRPNPFLTYGELKSSMLSLKMIPVEGDITLEPKLHINTIRTVYTICSDYLLAAQSVLIGSEQYVQCVLIGSEHFSVFQLALSSTVCSDWLRAVLCVQDFWSYYWLMLLVTATAHPS